MQDLKVMEVHGTRVLTTRQIAKMYETDQTTINNNFLRNKSKYVPEKHYIAVEGEEMRKLRTSHQFDGELRRVSRAYFWTEKGALLHAKSLNTAKAWEVYDYLVDFYFRAKEEVAETKPEITQAVPAPVEKLKKQELPQINNPIRILKVLLKVADDRGIKVNSFPFGSLDSMIKDNHIGIRAEVTVEKACYELAIELAHAFIHYDGGDVINSPLAKEYNSQAMRAADMIIKTLNVKMSQM